MSGIVELIKFYREKWIAAGTWCDPDLDDCIAFLVEEVGEVARVRNKQKTKYTRNNPEDTPVNFGIAVEAFDVIMMAIILLELLECNLNGVADWKLEVMDLARG